MHESLITPEAFARIFCADLDLPLAPWSDTVANQIRAQLEEHEGIASMDFGVDYKWMDAGLDVGADADPTPDVVMVDEIPECRVIVAVSCSDLFHAPLRHPLMPVGPRSTCRLGPTI